MKSLDLNPFKGHENLLNHENPLIKSIATKINDA